VAKGYWLAQVEVTDPEGYKDYVAANQAAFRKYGARYVIRAGRYEAVEGTCRFSTRGDRVCGLRNGARLLSFARISACRNVAAEVTQPSILRLSRATTARSLRAHAADMVPVMPA